MSRLAPFPCLALLLVLAACETETAPDEQPSAEPGETVDATVSASPDTANALMLPMGDSAVEGRVAFNQTEDGVRIQFDLTGLEIGPHGFHIHENGDCGPGDDGAPAGAAGGHFNPFDAPHGGPDTTREGRHVGDLGNVTARPGGRFGGVARDVIVDPYVSLSGPSSIIGRAVVVHDGADDLTSQPSGDAGGRIACGIIEAVDRDA